MATITDHTHFAPRVCEHCQQRAERWTWRTIEVYPTRTYQALCDDCASAQDADFTEEGAICFALIIVGMHQGRLDQEARTW